jgi:membrane protein required for colicin V production
LRELVTVFAFAVAALAAVYLLPVAGPAFRGFMKPAWVASAAAMVVVFVVVYVALRSLGHYITTRLHAEIGLGRADRGVGLGFGIVRGLLFLGVFYLVFNMATPPELVPTWIAKGKLYPLARISARALESVAPKGGPLAPNLARAVEEPAAPEDASAQTPRQNPPRDAPGYDKRARDDIDALIERTR